MAVNVGDIIEGTIINITQYGAFVQLDENQKGLVHISEISNKYVEDINSILKVGQIVKAKVLTVDNNKISLSIKQVENEYVKKEYKNYRRDNNNYNKKEPDEPKTFEDILSKFMKDSEERQIDIKKSFESKRGSSSRKI